MAESQRPANRLTRESSPYLLLHQHNPVDWYPWGDEAIERARELDRPIFLSVGYSTCYWCHVMERESFSDPNVARVMNERFVNIKMDREERPDLDEVYMVATQVLSGHGGWPNSVFLTPELEPFFAGTYFPPDDRYGQPAFSRVLTSLADAWKSRRDDIEEQARSVAGAMRRHLDRRGAPAPSLPDPGVARRSVQALERSFDAANGGFGGAPKFPTPSNLFLLLETAPVLENARDDSRAAEMLTATLDAMARGGIFDQLGGGFHRYATDAEWRVPHFEKMLYDNGLLLELYAREWARTGDPEMARVARETAAFLEREMRDEAGFFWSALDAETDGEEGAYYVWTRRELLEVLGEEDYQFAAPLLGFDGAPFFEGSHYVLHLPRRLGDQARIRRMELAELHQGLDPIRQRLLDRRQEREPVAVDDKVLVDWNGMAIAGLASVGRLLPDEHLTGLAERAAEAILERLKTGDGNLAHAWRAGSAKIDAFLSDYAFLTHGLLALDASRGEGRWLDRAVTLAEEQIARLRDPLGGFFNAVERRDLLVRGKEIVDGAVPATNSIAVLNLLTLAERTGEQRWLDEADAALKAFATQIEQAPEGARMMAAAVHRRYGMGVGTGGAGTGGAGTDTDPGAGGAGEPARETPMQARAAAAVRPHLELARADDEGWREFALRLDIEPGLHLQANPPGLEFLVPTAVTASDAELKSVVYPSGEPLESGFAEGPMAVYEGQVEIRGEVRGEGVLHLGYQACSTTGCLPVVRVDLPLGGSG